MLVNCGHFAAEHETEPLFEIAIGEQTKHARRNSFVALMDEVQTYFPEYESATEVPSMFLLSAELQLPPSDGESTASSLKGEEGIELPKAPRRPKKKTKSQNEKNGRVGEFSPAPLLIRKQIGLISLEQRQAKIKRYLEKRQRRQWGKKVSYDCRKRVADGRLRVKGRFVAKKTLDKIAEMKTDQRKEDSWEPDLEELLR